MIRKLKFFLITFIFFNINLIYAQNTVVEQKLSQGEKLFKENKPKEAVQVLENEILNGIVTANTYNFLGLGYYQNGDYSKSIDAFNRGITAQPTNIKILSFNQGNTYYAMKDYASAVNCFTKALQNEPTFYDALLNRANSLLMANQLVAAKTDYIDFITKCPEDSQKNQIERLIQALTDEIARREEEERLLREQNKAMWEEIDPSIDEDQGDEITWEKIEADIEDSEEENRTDWETIDASITEHEIPKKTVNWEDVDASITESEQPKRNINWENIDTHIPEQNLPVNKTEWEQIETPSNQNDIGNNMKKSEEEQINFDKSRENNASNVQNWEKLDFEKVDALRSYDSISDENAEDINNYTWETLSEDEALEIKQLEKESKIEYEKWLEEQSRIRQQKAEDELKRLQQKADSERAEREKLLEEVMKAEEARRKKLLDDVANSLQNGNSTNVTSGADDIIDYDLEGELD